MRRRAESEQDGGAPVPAGSDGGVPRRRRFLLLFILLALPFVLLVVVAAAGSTEVGQRWLAATITEQVNGRIAGRVELERASIWLDGIHLAGVEVWAPGEEEAAILAGEVQLAPALSPGLLRGQVRVRDVRLVDVRLRLVSPADGGASNLATAFSPHEPSPVDDAAGDATWEVIVDRLSIERGAAWVGTAGEAPLLDLTGLSLELRGRADAAGAALQGVAAASLAAPVRGDASIEIDATLSHGYRRIEARRLAGRIGASTFSLRGDADLEDLGARVEDLELRLVPADVPGLVEGFFPTVPHRLAGSARLSGGTLSAQLELEQEAAGPGPRRLLRIDAGIQPIARTWRLALEGDALDPHGFDTRAPSGAIDIRSSLAGAGLEEAEGTIDLPQLRLGAGSAGPIRIEGAYRAGRLDLKSLQATLAGGSLEARGEAGPKSGALHFDLNARNAKQLLAAFDRLATGAGVALPALPAVHGDLRVRGRMNGPWSAPSIAGEVRSASIAVGELEALRLDGDVDISGLPAAPIGRVSLRLERLDAGSNRFDDVEADLHLGGRQVRGTLDGSTAAGRVRADVDMTPDAGWQTLRFTRLDLRWPRASWSLRQPLLVELAAGTTLRGLSLQSASGGRIDGDGHLASSGALDLTVELSGIELAELPAQLAPAELGLVGTLAATARLQGTIARPKGAVQMRLADGGLFDIGGISIDGVARLDGRAMEAQLGLRHGDAQLEATAQTPWPIAARGDLQLDATLRRLDLAEVARLFALDEPLAGLVQADVQLRGSLADPRGTIDLQGDALAAAGVEGVTAKLHAALGEEISIRAEGGHLASRLQGDLVFATSAARLVDDPASVLEAPLRGTIDVAALQLARFFAAREDALPVRGKVDLRADVGGTLLAPRGSAQLSLADGWNGEVGPLDAELTLHAEAQASRLEITSRLLGRDFLAGRIAIDAALEQLIDTDALEDTARQAGRPSRVARAKKAGSPSISSYGLTGELAARSLDLGAIAWAGGYRGRATGVVDGTFRLGGTTGAPVFELLARVDELALGTTPFGDVDLDASYGSRRLATSVALAGDAGGTARLEGSWPIDLGLPAIAKGSLEALATAPLDLVFEAKSLDLAFARGLSRDLHQAEGKLDGAIRIHGPLPLPTFEGALALEEGRFGYTGHGDIRDVAIEIELQPDALHLRRFEATSSGTITASGAAKRKGSNQPYDIDLRLESKRFALVTGDIVRGWLDADATLTGRAGPDGVQARLAILRSRIELADTPDKDVQSLEAHPDFIIGRDGIPPTVRIDKKKGTGSANYPLVLEIVSESPIAIAGTDVDLEAATDLKLLLVGGSPQLVGVVQVDRGHVVVMSRRFEFSRGRVYYTGAEAAGDPRLDVVVRHESPVALVTITVGGTVQRPTTNLRSNPPHTESEIAELLATGRLQSRPGAAGGGATGAASALGAVLSSQLKKGIAAKLPLDVISFEAGEDDPFAGSRLEAGSYLTDRIYVGYARRFEAEGKTASERDRKNANEVRMEYQLAPRWTLEVTYGDANVGGADLVWSRDF